MTAYDKLFDELINSDFFKYNYKNYFDKAPKMFVKDCLYLTHGGVDIMDTHLLAEKIKIKNRKSPSDTYNIIHKILNALSLNKLGVKIRNLFFCQVHNYLDMSDYGNDPYVIFPLDNNYMFYYNDEVKDFTTFFGFGYGMSPVVNKIKFYKETIIRDVIPSIFKIITKEFKNINIEEIDLCNYFLDIIRFDFSLELFLKKAKNKKDFSFIIFKELFQFIYNNIHDYLYDDLNIDSKEILKIKEDIKIVCAKESTNLTKFIISDLKKTYIDEINQGKKLAPITDEVEVMLKSETALVVHEKKFNIFMKELFKYYQEHYK